MESCELNTSIFRCLNLIKLEMKNKVFNGIKQFFIRIVVPRFLSVDFKIILVIIISFIIGSLSSIGLKYLLNLL